MKSFKQHLIDLEEAYGPWGKKTPADLEKIRKALAKEKRTTVPGQLKKPTDAVGKRYKTEPTLKYFSKVGEEVEQIEELSKTTLASYEAGARSHAEKLTKQADKAKNPETKYPKYKKATMRYAGAHKARGKIFKKEFMGEDGMGAGAVAAGPTNTSSGGAIASVGQPPGSKFGEPGVYLGKKKKSDPRMFKQFRRKAPKM
jgi:hypothetical protein